MKRPKLFLQALLLLAAVAFAYAPTIRGGWLWDDPTEISANPLLRDPHGLAKIWQGLGTPDYFPLKTSLQWMQWHLWGADMRGYHLTNIALQALAAILLWRLLDRLGLRFAFFCALIFAVHPLAVESVAWMSELKNVLSLPLLLAAMTLYVRGGRRRYFASLALFTAAMLAKTSVVMFPGVLLLYTYWQRGRIGRKDLALVLPFFLVSAGLGIVTIHFQAHRVMAYLPMPPESITTRLAGAGWAIWFYLGKCLLPVGLLPIYPRWLMHPAAIWLAPPWIALAAAFTWCWQRRATWGRAALFGLGSFVLNLLPVLGIVPLAYARISRVSDHLAYLPLISAIALAGAAIALLVDHSPRLIRTPRAGLAAGCALVLAALLASRSYAGRFVSEEALWTYTVRYNPNAWLAHNNLGIALAQCGRIADALPHLQAAVALRPDLFGAQMNLGRALVQGQRLPEAIPQFAAAHQIDPANPDAKASLRAALNNYANALARGGQLNEAVVQYQKALAVDPANAECHRNYAFALHSLGRDAEAVEQLDQAEIAARAEGKSTR